MSVSSRSTGGFVWLLFDESLEGAGGFCLHPGELVLVGVDGERRVPMSEPLRHDLDGYSGFDEQRPVSVPDVVETRPTWSTVTSPSRRRTGCGWRT
jgi:hypothetical protein